MDKISRRLSILQFELKLKGSLRLFDKHRAMEDLCCKLLNIVYGWELKNLNRIKPDYPAIDLGDTSNKIAVQVTSDPDRTKIVDTLRKFHEFKLDKEYERLIIFVLGERSKSQAKIPSERLQFSAERDILDFKILQRDIAADEVIQEKVYDCLEELEPTVPRWIKRAAAYGLVLLTLLVISVIGIFLYGEYIRKCPDYPYDTDDWWMSLNEAADFYEDHDRISIYAENGFSNSFHDCAVLSVHYSNLSELERRITRFSVYAENIKQNNSPQLFHTIDSTAFPLTFRIKNEGWGETGVFQIDFMGIMPVSNTDSQQKATVTLRDDAPRSWQFNSIKPGEEVPLPLTNEEDFQVDRSADFEEPVEFRIMYELHAPDTGYRLPLAWLLTVTSDGISLSPDEIGGDDMKYYVVWIPTEEQTYECTYKIDQRLPPKQIMALPIFIVPDRSCTMTVRVEFTTQDGEVIKLTPLENAEFIIPYHEDEWEYVDGNLLDWDKVDGTEVICFPFMEFTEPMSQS